MKTKTLLTGASALGLALAMASNASAVEIGDMGQLSLAKLVGYSGGSGEFEVSRTGLDTSGYSNLTKNVDNEGSFQSFCIEKTEESSGAGYYTVNSQSDVGDPLSVGTAWLYCQFARGSLEGYDYTPGDGRESSASKLQRAIWALEDDVAPVPGNAYYEMALVHFGGEAAAKSDNKVGGFGVYVLNTFGDEEKTIAKQDRIYYTPVPDGGATVMLLGLALSGFGIARRFLGSKA